MKFNSNYKYFQICIVVAFYILFLNKELEVFFKIIDQKISGIFILFSQIHIAFHYFLKISPLPFISKTFVEMHFLISLWRI